MTSNWKDNFELAKALLFSIEKYSLKFTLGKIPTNPISSHECVNLLYYGNPAILSEDGERKLTFYSKYGESVFGYSPEKAIGMQSVNLVPKRLRGERETLFKKIIKEDKVKNVETIRIHKLGGEIKITAQVFPYEIRGKKNIAAIVEKF